MPLPEPTTRSPGSIKIVYSRNSDGAQTHSTGAHLVAGTSLTDLSALRLVALGFADKVASDITSALSVIAWRITDPLGAVLYEEGYSPIIPGSRVIDGASILSESVTHTYIGKGAAAVVGDKAGSTRTVIYRGSWNFAIDAGPTSPAASDPGDQAMLDFLNNETTLGADFYGQKAHYKNSIDIQLNAHWQKRYGF